MVGPPWLADGGQLVRYLVAGGLVCTTNMANLVGILPPVFRHNNIKPQHLLCHSLLPLLVNINHFVLNRVVGLMLNYTIHL